MTTFRNALFYVQLSGVLFWASSFEVAATSRAATSTSTTAAGVDHRWDVVEWLRSRGGYFNPKLKFRGFDAADDPNTPNTPVSSLSFTATGVVTTEDISKGESVIVLPPESLITPASGSEDICDVVWHLIKQYELGDASDFAPYVRYLFALPVGRLPSAWSAAGRDLLGAIIGRERDSGGGPGFLVRSYSFQDDCGGSGDPVQEQAYMIVISCSWTNSFLPVVDTFRHRNGRWTNVDSHLSDFDGGTNNITVFASRDIAAGEELYISHNDCSDCSAMSLKYGLQAMVGDYGFVEQYPRRFIFGQSWHGLYYPREDKKPLVFDVDVVAESGTAADYVDGQHLDEHQELKVIWHSEKPDMFQLNFLRGNLKQLHDIREDVYKRAEELVSKHERDVTIELYEALSTALELAIWEYWKGEEERIDDAQNEECAAVGGTTPCGTGAAAVTPASSSFASRQYDDLHEQADPLDHGMFLCDGKGVFADRILKRYARIDHVESPYQDIDFFHDEHKEETCLFLNGLIQACSEFRPHYHETHVHYPARFIKEMKRVAFIGGGDSMLLYEILKYSATLELVIGLELDQQVVRSSFKHFGTQPHWDNDIVEWWYGDAAMSLNALPAEYYGSFDLVIVDLEFSIAEDLWATDQLRIIDAAVLLARADTGIIAKNQDWEDFIPTPVSEFTDYTVTLNFRDVPTLFRQVIILGSNSVNFLSTETTIYHHDIETKFLKPGDDIVDHFDSWYNYAMNGTRSNNGCKERGTKEKETATDSKANSIGVLMIIEAENATALIESSSSSTSMQMRIKKALLSVGLTELSSRISVSRNDYSGGDVLMFILQEGYVVARTWPEHRYCAFDVLLWSGSHKLNSVKGELLRAVGSTVGESSSSSSSSFRIVTGGMFGSDTPEEERKKYGPPDLCEEENVDDNNKITPLQDDSPAEEKSSMFTIIREGIALVQGANEVIAVFCGERSVPCISLEALSKKKSYNVVPVWSCAAGDTNNDADDLGNATEDEVVSSQATMFACENVTLRGLQESVEQNGKIGGIVIDVMAPRAMGRILHKIFSSASHRRDILTNEYVVLGVIPNQSESSWRKELLERFRTEFAMFDPSYRADILFNSTDSNDRSSSVRLGIFSTGDSHFYLHLVDLISQIEEKADFVAEVRNVQNGLLNYVADFEATRIVTPKSYNVRSPLEQWFSQIPLGQQMILQFEFEMVTGDERHGVCFSRDGQVPMNEFVGANKIWTQNESASQLSSVLLKGVLEGTLLSLGVDDLEETHVYDGLGNGCLVVVFWSEGSAIVHWDGLIYVDANVFLYEEKELHQGFELFFLEFFLEGILPAKLTFTSGDSFPRGFGRVVNSKEEIGARDGLPLWAQGSSA